MAVGDFDSYYGVEPWSAIDIKERDWYVPELQRAFRQTSRYSQMVPIKVDFGAVRTKKIIWTGLWNLEPDITAIGDRSLHKYDELVTFFRSSGRQAGTLAPLCRTLMSDAIVDHMEKQIRNAFLSLPVRYFIGGGTGFGDIGASDLFDPGIAMDISLEFQYNDVLDPNNPNGVSHPRPVQRDRGSIPVALRDGSL